jgi:hypothetical protein
MIRGRPFELGNKLSSGRPKGSRNKSPSIGAQLLEEHEKPLTERNLAESLRHDTRSRLWCLEELKRLREQKLLACKLKLPPIRTRDDVVTAHDMILNAVTNNKCSEARGHALFDMVGHIEKRIADQEKRTADQEFSARLENVERLLTKT